LWDLETASVYAFLGDDLTKWQQILLEIKKARSTFDNSESAKSFGALVIDYGHVQAKVNAKYDSWQHEFLNRFGDKLAGSMRSFHGRVSKARHGLEQQAPLEGSSTGDAVRFVTFLQEVKSQLPQWKADVEIFRSGQRILERQRYVFPQDWLHVEAIEGEWSAFNDIFNRKQSILQQQLGMLLVLNS
jgi:dynein heavy chain 1